jgi:hypothetical protein
LSTWSSQDFRGPSGSQPTLGASAEWSTRPSQDFGDLLSFQLNLAATSFSHNTLTRRVSRNAYDRIHLTKFQDSYCSGQIFLGASTSQSILEPLKGEHQYTILSTAEVPAMFTYIIALQFEEKSKQIF